MSQVFKVPDKGDPSDILQLFPKYNLKLLCCRYWWLKKWEFRELSFPYWRIYYNAQKGAFLNCNGIKHELVPEKIYVIAPNTSYSTHLFDNKIPEYSFAIEGGKIGNDSLNLLQKTDFFIEHLFIHFNIGMPYDNVAPGIFSFDLTSHLNQKIQMIIEHLKEDSTQFSFYSYLALQSLISDLLAKIDETNWDLRSNDNRILAVLNYIEKNISENLSNEFLSGICHMATNSFTRLFNDEIGTSPQRYIRKKRIDAACIHLHYSNYTIDKIAALTGFTNRYHFTRIFTTIIGISPARYRKEFGI